MLFCNFILSVLDFSELKVEREWKFFNNKTAFEKFLNFLRTNEMNDAVEAFINGNEVRRSGIEQEMSCAYIGFQRSWIRFMSGRICI